MIKVAIITTDLREHNRDYKNTTPSFGTAPEALLQGFAQIPEIEIHVISCLQKPVSSPEKLAPNIWYHGLHVPKIGWMRTAFQGCIRAVRKKLKAIQPHIVHGQGTERDGAISAVFSGFPNILTIHGNMRAVAQKMGARPFSYAWLAARLEKRIIPRSNGVVCITNYIRAAVDDLARRTWVVPNAVDAKFFDLKPAPEFPPIVLCAATVYVIKNQINFIHALDSLAEEKQFRVIFLGTGNRSSPYFQEFLRLVSNRPWCSYEGFADREKLKAYYQRATMLALPSYEDNCPMVVLESMAAGLPVLAAKIGGVPDLIEERKTGLFCNPSDFQSMKAGVAEILNHSPAAASMAARAKQSAHQRFHPLSIARQHLEIYREVMKRS